MSFCLDGVAIDKELVHIDGHEVNRRRGSYSKRGESAHVEGPEAFAVERCHTKYGEQLLHAVGETARACVEGEP